jgi:superfamily II DNA or RNA helicase
MVENSDLTFITNEGEQNLKNRFSSLIKDTKFFDCLVGYFYTSGFHNLYKSLENTEKIRILIGISTNRQTYDLIQDSKKEIQETLKLSHKETKEVYAEQLEKEYENSPDNYNVEEGTQKFLEWLKSGRLEIRAYPDEKIHAKVYIMTFGEDDRDVGRVITGSSNFTESGLRQNMEFNVELKNRSDYEFAKNKFEELWKNSVDVSEKYIETIKNKTWLNDEITPYELYLKFLYEYLKEKINIDQIDLFEDYYKPDNYMDLKYQKDAVTDAKSKLEEFGGVFISDVVGLGKTYIATMLARELDGGTLVIAPPVLLNKDNPGSWWNAFNEFGIRRADFISRGQLDKIIKRGTDKFKNIIIDEAHGFRNESTQMYEQLFQICRGKRVILVSATPLNNTPMDILSQIKLFQNAHKSTLPNPKVRDLEKYFKRLQSKLKDLDRQKDKEEYLKIIKENAQEIRENVLQYLMVRRTRSSIVEYYGDDLKKQKLKFPEVEDPKPIIYNFDENLEKIFNQTLNHIINDITYARYKPLLYTDEKSLSNLEKGSQKNMVNFMKGVLLKRLESSFFAFKKTVGRFIKSYEAFIKSYEKGNVYFSKKHTAKILDFIESDDEEGIEKLIENEKAEKIPIKSFNSDFIAHLKKDLKILQNIQDSWKDINYDPKLDKFKEILGNDSLLKKNKIVVFTESKETAQYLEENLNAVLNKKLIAFSSESSESERSEIIENFDARKKDQGTIRLLITTDILSEGVNLHRSNVVMNYDIPWNPIRMMQRVGRINRVDSKHDRIYTYNFFPAGPLNENIKLKEAAEAKISAFIEMLGNDAKLLTDEEVKSHDLFMKLNSKSTIIGEEEKEEDIELKYLTKLREIRDNDKKLFERIKRLPKKARTSKAFEQPKDAVLTFFRKGKLRKIFLCSGGLPEEINFAEAIKILDSNEKTKKEFLKPEFYEKLSKNKIAFDEIFEKEEENVEARGISNEINLLKRIKAIYKAEELTEEDETYLLELKILLEDGAVPKATIKKILKEISKEINPIKILAKIKKNVPEDYFKKTFVSNSADITGPKEVILSEYLVGGNQEI